MALPDRSDSSTDLYMENGRGYCTLRRGQYMMPVDQKEQERLDIMHTMIQAARPRESRLHNAPFNASRNPETGEPARVLDIGHGTGLWCLEMAEKYQDVQFYGFDMAHMEPKDLHENVDLRSGFDYETEWNLGNFRFDFIHLQMGLGSVSDWPLLYRKIYKHLKPGGWFEHVEIDWTPRSDDDTLNPTGLFRKWWEQYVAPPYGVAGRPLAYNEETGNLLATTGFTQIQKNSKRIRIPTRGWSDSKSERVAGHWWSQAMGSGDGCGHGLEAMSLAVLTRIQRWSPDHAQRLCQDVMKEASDPRVHAYNNLWIWWAQKPFNAPY